MIVPERRRRHRAGHRPRCAARQAPDGAPRRIFTFVRPPSVHRQRQDRVGQRRQRRAGLHARRLLGLQSARRTGTRVDRSHHRRSVTASASRASASRASTSDEPLTPDSPIPSTSTLRTAYPSIAALVETGQRSARSRLLRRTASLAPRRWRPVLAAELPRRPISGLLLLHRTHKRAFLPTSRDPADCSVRPNRATNHRRRSGP